MNGVMVLFIQWIMLRATVSSCKFETDRSGQVTQTDVVPYDNNHSSLPPQTFHPAGISLPVCDTESDPSLVWDRDCNLSPVARHKS